MITINIQEKTETPEDMAFLLREIANQLERGCFRGVYPTWETKKEMLCTLRSKGHICFQEEQEYFSIGENIWASPITSFMNDEGFRKNAIYIDPDNEKYRNYHGFSQKI